uniref:SKP1 component POZ domain-containing protein n=1 Tax=Monopterus albus TaxID=43700 RepID=A0A3Q3Q1C5_MONAL
MLPLRLLPAAVENQDEEEKTEKTKVGPLLSVSEFLRKIFIADECSYKLSRVSTAWWLTLAERINKFPNRMDGEERTYGGCEGPDAMYVKLISSDGHEFIVKREHALTSGTIKAMLSGPGEYFGKLLEQILFKVSQVGWGELEHSHFQISPDILCWVQVWTSPEPPQEFHRAVLKPLLSFLGDMLQVFLLECKPLSPFDILSTLKKVFIQNCFISFYPD